MVRRWIIRSVFLGALVCVLGIWIVSYFGTVGIVKTVAGRLFLGEAHEGRIFFLSVGHMPNPNTPLESSFAKGASDAPWQKTATTLGFHLGRVPRSPDSMLIIFPLWLPSVLSAALSWFVWRWSRPKMTRSAFPVEPKAQST